MPAGEKEAQFIVKNILLGFTTQEARIHRSNIDPDKSMFFYVVQHSSCPMLRKG